MRSKTVAISLLAMSLAGCGVYETQAQPTVTPAYGEDAVILRNGLRDLYPSYNRFGQGEDLTAALDRLDEIAADTRDPMVFYRAVAEVAAAARDEHVIPFPSEAYRQSRRDGQMMLPYTVRWIDEVPYIAAVADMAHADLIGQRVLEFDGHESSNVRDVLSATIPSDGSSETFAIRRLEDFTPTQNENYFDLNYPIWFGVQDQYEIRVGSDRGNSELVRMPALAWSEFVDFYQDRLPRETPVTFRWLDETTAYLSVLSFHDRYYEAHGVNAEAVFSEMARELATRPEAALILDLRRNEGGGDISSLLLDFLMDAPFVEYDQIYTSFVGQPAAAQHCENANEVIFDPNWSEPGPDGLYQLRPEYKGLITGALERTPRPDAFTGELVVLISGATGSAAAKVSAVLDREDRGRFVGEETGGAAAGATAFGYCRLLLPDSGISVELPLIWFEREMDIPNGRGVLPDLEVDAGRTPPVTAQDDVLNAALDLLASSPN